MDELISKQRLLTQKEASIMLGYSANSNILAQMRMPVNKGKWQFIPRWILINGVVRYPLDWLEEDIKKFKEGLL